MALVINCDTIKESLDGYNPAEAEKFHTTSAKQADKEYEIAIKNAKKNEYESVIFLCGGSASGKTEFVDSHLKELNAIILDSTFSSKEGAKNKIRPAKKKNLKISVYFIQPASLIASYQTFLGRDRQFPVEYFIKTHIGARKTALLLLEEYPEIQFNYIINQSFDQRIRFESLLLEPKDMIEILVTEQLTEDEITEIIYST